MDRYTLLSGVHPSACAWASIAAWVGPEEAERKHLDPRERVDLGRRRVVDERRRTPLVRRGELLQSVPPIGRDAARDVDGWFRGH